MLTPEQHHALEALARSPRLGPQSKAAVKAALATIRELEEELILVRRIAADFRRLGQDGREAFHKWRAKYGDKPC